MYRIAVQAPEAPIQALDAGRVELIGVVAVRAIDGPGRGCNAWTKEKPPDVAEGL